MKFVDVLARTFAPLVLVLSAGAVDAGAIDSSSGLAFYSLALRRHSKKFRG